MFVAFAKTMSDIIPGVASPLTRGYFVFYYPTLRGFRWRKIANHHRIVGYIKYHEDVDDHVTVCEVKVALKNKHGTIMSVYQFTDRRTAISSIQFPLDGQKCEVQYQDDAVIGIYNIDEYEFEVYDEFDFDYDERLVVIDPTNVLLSQKMGA